MILKIALLSALITFAIWKVKAKKAGNNWKIRLNNNRKAESAGRLRLKG